MSEFKSQYDRQKRSAENAHYYELLYYLQQLKNEPLQKTQQFLLKLVVAYFAITDNSSHSHGQELFLLKNAPKYDIIMETIGKEPRLL